MIGLHSYKKSKKANLDTESRLVVDWEGWGWGGDGNRDRDEE